MGGHGGVGDDEGEIGDAIMARGDQLRLDVGRQLIGSPDAPDNFVFACMRRGRDRQLQIAAVPLNLERDRRAGARLHVIHPV